MRTLAALLALAILTTACQTVERRTYKIQGRTIIIEVMSEEELRKDPLAAGAGANGYNVTYGNFTHIRLRASGKVDKNGNPLPYMEEVGEEFWHLPELGGDFHEIREGHKPRLP